MHLLKLLEVWGTVLLKSKSIIVSTRLVGMIAGVLLVISTFLAVKLSVILDERKEVHRAVMLYDVLFLTHPSKKVFEIYRTKHKLTAVDGDEMLSVRTNGTPFIKDALIRRTLQSGDIEIFVYHEHYYYAYKMDTMHYYRSDEPMTPYKFYIAITFAVLVLLLISLYRYILSSISPLKDLYIQIQRFAKGEKSIHIKVDGNDEVAQVANAFYDSVLKNKALEKSRLLFLRNVMHELKTPISKGKLLMHFLDGTAKDKLLMENIFEQMQGHLSDLARVESITAENLSLDKQSYAVIDILDHAIDMLDMNRKELVMHLHDSIIEADFNLFAYALKNLLDNANKYATDKPIYITLKSNMLTISNTGQPFTEGIETYLKAYHRDNMQHALEGMGLGLYIVNEVVHRHGYELEYTYSDKKHHFSIYFT